jgi:hypothetical protein
MNRPRIDWAKVRERFEAGDRIADLAVEHQCTARAIQAHAKSEGWQRPEGWTPARSRDGRGGGRGCDLSAPLTAADVQARHRADWERLRPLCDDAIQIARTAQNERALKSAQLVKTLIAGLRELQSGERLAWGVTDTAPPLDEISDEQLEAAIAEASLRIARAREQRDGDNGGATIH